MTCFQPALFADLEPEPGEDVKPVGVIFRCSGGHARRMNYAPGLARPSSLRCHCGRVAIGKPIVGTFSSCRRCDARCMFAKGPNCECSCAGANHGAGWSFR